MDSELGGDGRGRREKRPVVKELMKYRNCKCIEKIYRAFNSKFFKLYLLDIKSFKLSSQSYK